MFENRLKFVRERNGISQKELSQFLGINKSAYSNYESERYIILLKYLMLFSDYLNISIDYLFGLNNNIKLKFKKCNDLKLIGLRLKELRKDLNISQELLARRTKNKRSNISGYEIGKCLISTKELYTICKKYNISADYLLGKIDSPKYFK